MYKDKDAKRKYQKEYRAKTKSRLEYNKRYYARTRNSKNSRYKWTDADIDLVIDKKLSDNCLSKILGRSVAAIQVMRSKIRRINEN